MVIVGVGRMMLAGICRTEVEVRGGEEQPRSYICDRLDHLRKIPHRSDIS